MMKSLLYETQIEENCMVLQDTELVGTGISDFGGKSDEELSGQILNPRRKCCRGNAPLPKKSILNRILSLQMLDTAGLQTTSNFYGSAISAARTGAVKLTDKNFSFQP